MSEELKPCPFCGGKAREVIRKGVLSERFSLIYCTKCEHSSGLFKGIKVAQEYWNTRPIENERDKQIAELKAELSRNADEGYVGFMLGIEQMKKKLAEKGKEIDSLKYKLNNIKDTLTKYRDDSLSTINAKEAEDTHFFAFAFCSHLLEIINDTNNNGGSMEKEQ
jgi:thymidylate synthase